MQTNQYTIKSKVWIYPGPGAWYFVTVPKKESGRINLLFSSMKRGWGSLPVAVTVGKTSWKTSIFPDKKTGTYLLPLKASVRKTENVKSKDEITFTIEIKV